MIRNEDFEKMMKGEPVSIYLYQDDDENTFTNASFNMDGVKPLRLASIEDVKAELGTGEDDVYEYPILVQEGVFVWNENDMEYKKQA